MPKFVQLKQVGYGPIAVSADHVMYVRPDAQGGNSLVAFAAGRDNSVHTITVEGPMREVIAALEGAG